MRGASAVACICKDAADASEVARQPANVLMTSWHGPLGSDSCLQTFQHLSLGDYSALSWNGLVTSLLDAGRLTACSLWVAGLDLFLGIYHVSSVSRYAVLLGRLATGSTLCHMPVGLPLITAAKKSIFWDCLVWNEAFCLGNTL